MGGCINYDRSDVIKSIFVNHQSLSLFVGEQMQLTASPTDGTYQYKWTSEDPAIATVSGDGLVAAVAEGATNIIVSSGDVSTRVPISSVIRVPVTDVRLSERSVALFPGDKRTIIVSYIPENANDIPKFSWSSDDSDIASINQGGEITAVEAGITNIFYRLGDITKSATVIVSYTSPFKGPHIISASAPLELLAANFDLGGEGYAFHDNDEGSHTGNTYRRDNGDPKGHAVEVEGNGTNIGYTGGGEWLLYTVEVKDEGEYLFDISESAGGDGGKFYLEVDGVNVTGSIDVPNNGSWGNWRWHPPTPKTITLTEGIHKMRFYIENGGFNLRALRFTKK